MQDGQTLYTEFSRLQFIMEFINNPTPLLRCPCGYSCRSPGLRMGTTLVLLCRWFSNLRVLGVFFFCSSYLTEMMVTFKRYCCNSIGKGIRAAYQHPHQDRRVPDTDHEVSDAAHVQTFRIPAQKHFKTKSKHATHTDPWNNRAQVMVEFEKLWPLLEEKG